VKKVKDNILIHHFTDYPTHSVELIMSEIAGAPKYLLDAPEGRFFFGGGGGGGNAGLLLLSCEWPLFVFLV